MSLSTPTTRGARCFLLSADLCSPSYVRILYCSLTSPHDRRFHQDNRAVTIKDLAEMTVNFGLVCQK